MCFSAEASFIASGSLALLGGATFVSAKKKEKVVALIPFLFAIQQGFEGIQWLYLNQGNSSLLAGYAFLFFALIVWPLYIPSAIYNIDKKERNMLRWFVCIGFIVAGYFVYTLLTQPIHIVKINSCISYQFILPYRYIVNTGYLIAVLAPLFLSSKKIINWFGVVTLVTATLAWYYYTYAFTSVWCFFAAVVSIMLVWYARVK